MCDSECSDCIHLLHYKYDREVDISCRLSHDAKLYSPVTDCIDYDTEKNCYNCKHNRSVHDGYCVDSMCAKDMMNIGGYYDYEYYKLPRGSVCPEWEWEEW